MKLCVNPACRFENPDDAEECSSCQTRLLIGDRYFAVRNLRSPQRQYAADIYEVTDIEDSGQRKILKTFVGEGKKLEELFQREQQILTKLRHEGIVRGEKAFLFRLSNGRELSCLVMEKIPGQDLEAWLKNHGAINQQQALDWLQQLTTIIGFLHQQQYFHRDIKPSNIMLHETGKVVLIDFNAVREISDTVIEGGDITKVYTESYAAPEQKIGSAVPQSDFYALGRTFVHLLTGICPKDIHPDISHWREKTLYPIDNALLTLIDNLIAEQPENRPQTSQQILAILSDIETSKKDETIGPNHTTIVEGLIQDTLRHKRFIFNAKSLFLLLFLGVITCLGFLILLRMQSKEACNLNIGDNISCGEENLAVDSHRLEEVFGAKPPKQKSEGTQKFLVKKYAEAEQLFLQAWNQQKDPETLIYLNNTRINKLINEKKINENQVINIAFVVPLGNNKFPESYGRALSDMRGVAQAQNEALKKNIYLRVVLASDNNDRNNKAKEIAIKLSQNKNILAVIGHDNSETSKAALPIYSQNKLALISHTSVSEELKDNNFFRIVPPVSVYAKALANYVYEYARVHKVRVAVFGNPDSSFSHSLTKEFRNKMGVAGEVMTAEDVTEFNLSNQNFNVNQAIKKAKEQKVNAIVLIPDIGVSPIGLKNAISIINSNHNFDLILGGGSMSQSEVLTQKAANRLVLALPWDKYSDINSKFSQSQNFLNSAANLWGKRDFWETNYVRWGTATAYDATWLILEALSKNKSREGIQQVLSDPKFEYRGVTGMIKFAGSNRQEIKNQPPITLATVIPYCNQPKKYNFVPLENKLKCFQPHP